MVKASTASSADTPFQGAPAAWAERPEKVTSKERSALEGSTSTSFSSEGCQERHTSTSSKRPSRTMNTFPMPCSSAGVP